MLSTYILHTEDYGQTGDITWFFSIRIEFLVYTSGQGGLLYLIRDRRSIMDKSAQDTF